MSGAGAEGDTQGTPLFETAVVAYDPFWRGLSALLRICSHSSMVVLLAMFFLAPDAFPTNPLKQIRVFSGFYLAPELAAWLLARAFAARLVVTKGLLTIERRESRTDIPLDAVMAVELWRVPAPGNGLSLRLRSGKRWPQSLRTVDADRLVEAMVAAGASASLRDGLHGVFAAYARACAANAPTWMENPFFKFAFYSLVPTIPAFRLNQWIVFGGTFGEYYTYGLQAYLIGFALWWASWTFCVAVYATGLRLGGELVSVFFAAVAPRVAATSRRLAIWAQRLLYYGGIPTVLILRFWE